MNGKKRNALAAANNLATASRRSMIATSRQPPPTIIKDRPSSLDPPLVTAPLIHHHELGPLPQVEEIPLSTRFWRTATTEVRKEPPRSALPKSKKLPPSLASSEPLIANASTLVHATIPLTSAASSSATRAKKFSNTQSPPLPNLPYTAPSTASLDTHLRDPAQYHYPLPNVSLLQPPPSDVDRSAASAAIQHSQFHPSPTNHVSAATPALSTAATTAAPSSTATALPQTPRTVHDAARSIVNGINPNKPLGGYPLTQHQYTPFSSFPSAGGKVDVLHSGVSTLVRPDVRLTKLSEGEPELGSENMDETARKAAKRKSGWANWLRKQAGVKLRTLEEWHEERIKRRRGIAWMRNMIEEFGLAPSPTIPSPETYADGSKPAGSVSSFANTLAALGHPAGPKEVKRLGGPGPGSGGDSKNQSRKPNKQPRLILTAPTSTHGATPIALPATPRPLIVSESPQLEALSAPSKRLAASVDELEPPQKRTRLSPDAVIPDLTPITHPAFNPAEPRPSLDDSQIDLSRETHEIEARETAKRKAIAARNGAPVGWVYEYVVPIVPQASAGVVEHLPRSARRARPSLTSR